MSWPLLTGGGSAPVARPPRLTVSDYWFVRPDGTLHRRKSITAFTLPKRAATGRKDDALRYMDWWAGLGGNEFRAFTRVDWTGPPSSGVETGWEYDEDACLWVLEQAAQRGCYVELVAHTGRYATIKVMAEHLRNVDLLCESQSNGLLAIYNEPQQNGGNDLVETLIRQWPPLTPGWASGVYDQTPYPAGPAMTYHSPRKDEWSRCFKDAYEYSTGDGPNVRFVPGYHGPVMLDEPPQVEQTIRDQDRAGWPAVDDWEVYGAGAAFFAAGATLHGNPDFQQCVIPTNPDVLACARAFLRGFDRIPLQRFHGYDRGVPPSANPGSRRYFRWSDTGQKHEITVRPFSFGTV